jgi:hypothetical protein
MEELSGWHPVEGGQLVGRFGDAGTLGPWIETDDGSRYAFPRDTEARAQLETLDPAVGDRVNITFIGGHYTVILEG